MSVDRLNRLDLIDALRGAAALMVVIYHARAEYWIGLGSSYSQLGLAPTAWPGYMFAPFSFGWLGVHLFFVISGYCIHRSFSYSLSRNNLSKVDWSVFFKRRFFRIYPVYITALCLGGLLDNYLNANEESLTISSFVTSITALQGILFPLYGSNSVFWTLSIEIHLYLFFPVLYFVGSRFSPWIMLAFSFVLSGSYLLLYHFAGLADFFNHAHAGGPVFLPYVFMWTLGAIIADIESGRIKFIPSKIFYLVAIVIFCAGLLVHRVHGEIYSAMLTGVGVFAFTLWFLTSRRELSKQSYALKYLSWLGIISFSLYATHRISFNIINLIGLGGQDILIWKALFSTVFSVGLAFIFYIVIERPSSEYSSRFR
jgi:peptidoglycan/LPS O-acetylase OafA/YrhL